MKYDSTDYECCPKCQGFGSDGGEACENCDTMGIVPAPPEPPTPSCVICKKEFRSATGLRDVRGGWKHPNKGVAFRSTGNFGSQVYDAMNVECAIQILICDSCLVRIRDYVRITPPRTDSIMKRPNFLTRDVQEEDMPRRGWFTIDCVVK